jgi:monoamine oxidase
MNQAKGASMHSELELTRERKYAMPESVPCVVIVGGGFAGLAAARALKEAAVRIILIDRTNHFCDRATRLPIDCGSHRARVGEVNTSDGSFNCTLIAATRHARGFEQMNSQHERTQ